MTLLQLERLSNKVFRHYLRHGPFTPEGEYWWKHFEKLQDWIIARRYR